MSKINIGQYYPIDSSIHRLDPRIKLIGVLYFIVVLFNLDNILGYATTSIILTMVIYASKIPVKVIAKSLKSIIFLLVFTTCLNLFLTSGETILFQLGFIKVTLEGVKFALITVYRLVLLITSSSLLTLTTTPIQLTNALEMLLKPLGKIGVPYHDIAMIMTIALRFIPTLMEEMDKIMKAQISRGSNFETGNLFEKAKSLLPVLIPLFISSFRRADELAMAMESRCYRGNINRTKMKTLRFSKSDYLFLLYMLVYLIFVIFVGKL